jgi:hypothetical protein
MGGGRREEEEGEGEEEEVKKGPLAHLHFHLCRSWFYIEFQFVPHISAWGLLDFLSDSPPSSSSFPALPPRLLLGRRLMPPPEPPEPLMHMHMGARPNHSCTCMRARPPSGPDGGRAPAAEHTGAHQKRVMLCF